MQETDCSSPPLLPSSPPLLPQPHHHHLTLRKKRTRSATVDDSHTSSDPPLFSSDPPDEGLENYERPRRKRKHQGTWWDHGHSHSQARTRRQKQELARNFDSGVFMGSDRTELSSDGLLELSASLNQSANLFEHVDAPATTSRDLSFSLDTSFASSQLTQDVDDETMHDLVAEEIISKCVEDNKEGVDLTALGLRRLSDDTLKPLGSLIKPPKISSKAPDPQHYSAFTPNLQIYLSQNLLQSLPTRLWSLDNLTVLSLRNNRLRELPAGIGHLRNLQELNVAGNQLRYLPGELLSLLGPRGKLKKLRAHPNPFFQGFRLEERADPETSNRWEFPQDPASNERTIAALEEVVRRGDGSDYQELYRLLLYLHRALAQSSEAAARRRPASRAALYSASSPEPEPAEYDPWTEQKRLPVFVAASAISRFRFDGSWDPSSPVPPSQAPAGTDVIRCSTSLLPAPAPRCAGDINCDPFTSTSSTPNPSHPHQDAAPIPTLLELALRTCAQPSTYTQLTRLPLVDLSRALPPPVLRLLDQVRAVRREGGRWCAVCSGDASGSPSWAKAATPAKATTKSELGLKEFVLPRTEWLEYWHYEPGVWACEPEELFLPFLRRGCGVRCVRGVLHA